MAWATDTSPKQWRPFKPAGENFSAEMPAGGKHVKLPVPLNDGSGGSADLNVYMVRDGYAIYMTMWMTGPSYGESDRTALDQAVGGFLKGLTLGYQRGGGGEFSCELEGERKFSIAGYTASEYDLPSCTVPAKVRVFTRVNGTQRQMYIGGAFYWRAEPNVARFMNSFTVKR